MSSTRSCLFVMSAYLTLLLYHTLLYIQFLLKKKKRKKEIQSQYFSIYKFVLWFAIIFLHQLIHVLLLMQCTWLITCISCLHHLCWKKNYLNVTNIGCYHLWLVNWLFNVLKISNISVRGWPYSVCIWDFNFIWLVW